jgi:hypothetical protein
MYWPAKIRRPARELPPLPQKGVKFKEALEHYATA